MAITRPVTKTIISTTAFGVPVVDEVNSLRDWVTANAPTPWVAMPMMNGATAGASGAPMARKMMGNVQMKGGFVNGPNGTASCSLPAGHYPTVAVEMIAYQFNGGWIYCNITIDPANGQLRYVNPPGVSANSSLVSLFGLMFPIT